MCRRNRTFATRIRQTLTVVVLAALAGTAFAPTVAAHDHRTIQLLPDADYESGDGDRGDGFCVLQPVLAGIGQATCEWVNERYPCSGEEEGSQARGGYGDTGVVLSPDGDGDLYTCELAQNCFNETFLNRCIYWLFGSPQEWEEWRTSTLRHLLGIADDHAPD